MRKLRKNHVRFENSVESYTCNNCRCTCNCTCNFQSGVLEFNVGSTNAFSSNMTTVRNWLALRPA